MKFLASLLLPIVFLVSLPAQSQSGMFKQKKERKKVWRRWSSHKDGYNPYLSRKNRNKPSAKLARENRKEVKRQTRAAKRQARRAKRGAGRR